MERLNKIKGAIFDLDGTLLDSMSVWEDIDRIFLTKRNVEIPDDYIDSVTPLGFKEAAVYTISRFALSETPEDLMKEWRLLAAEAYAHEIKLKPFAEDYLIKLKKQGVKLGVATALGEELYIPALKNNGVFGLFDSFASLNEVQRGKGYPDVYDLEAAKLELDPRDCAVFEDILSGVKAAKTGGYLSVGVYDSFSERDRARIKQCADIYIESFGQLL